MCDESSKRSLSTIGVFSQVLFKHHENKLRPNAILVEHIPDIQSIGLSSLHRITWIGFVIYSRVSLGRGSPW